MSYQRVKKEAAKILEASSITKPPVNVYAIAKRLGIRVVDVPHVPGFSGFLHRDADGTPVIGVNKADNPRRQAFTIAHEIGHFRLHPNEAVHVDKEGAVSLLLRSDQSSAGTVKIEIEANQFAAELLMPEPFLKEDVAANPAIAGGEAAEIKKLAAKYGVSVQAMSIRLGSLFASM